LDPAEENFGPTWDEAEKRQVRNRLIVLGTIVVVGGAALLRFVGEGAGDVTVPMVTNLRINQAELTLTKDGLRSNAQCQIGKDSGGVVVSQSPSSGHQIKAGSSVTLIVYKDSC
jgi:beta-lactam-binding protein with PASTA domain